MIKPDLTVTQVEDPVNRICDSGHIPSEHFILDDSEIKMRFFRVSGKNINGTYCEFCLTIANKISRKNKGLE